jgi:hypothetical protein
MQGDKYLRTYIVLKIKKKGNNQKKSSYTNPFCRAKSATAVFSATIIFNYATAISDL